MENLFSNILMYGVPNNENTNINDYISEEYPLTVPFYVNIDTTKISTAVMTYKYNPVERFVNSSDQIKPITVCINESVCPS